MERFKVTQFVKEYVNIHEDKWDYIEVKQNLYCPTFDDLQNLILTLTECSRKAVKFMIEKEEVPEDE